MKKKLLFLSIVAVSSLTLRCHSTPLGGSIALPFEPNTAYLYAVSAAA